MDCIKCDGQLQSVMVGDVEVDKCDKCSGIWFDMGELGKVLGSDAVDKLKNEIDNNAGDDVKKASCPRCGGDGKMVQVTSIKNHHIHVDTCVTCYGQWLDGGEIEELSHESLIEKIKGWFK